MESFFSSIVSFTASQDLWTVIVLLAWCAIGEVGYSIPYVLESFWLLVGFNIGAGVLSPWYLILLWLAALVGRQAGSIGLYRIVRFGVPVLSRFFRKIRLDRFFHKLTSRAGAVSRIDIATPFPIAFGRMVGMRVPMLLVMAAKQRPGMLALGVLIYSVVWDALYISIGAIFGSTVRIEPGYMLLISLGVTTVIYLVTLGVRKLVKRYRQSVPAVSDTST